MTVARRNDKITVMVKATGGIIYGLFDPTSRELRYIGKTSGTLRKRLREHLCRARSGTHGCHSYSWLKSIDYSPESEILEEVSDDLAGAEVWWIEYMRSVGAKLTNHTDGGEGASGYRHTAEARQKISNAKRGIKRPNLTLRKTSKEQDAIIVARYGAGESCSRIAVDFQMSVGGIRKILLRYGVELRSSVQGRWLTEMAARPSNPTSKVCRICHEDKSLEEFCFKNDGLYGHASTCRRCESDRYYQSKK